MQAHQCHPIACQQLFLVVLAARIGIEQGNGIDETGQAGAFAALDVAGQGVEDFVLVFNPALGGLRIFFLTVDFIGQFQLVQQVSQGVEQAQRVFELALIAFDQSNKFSDGGQGLLPHAVELFRLLQ